MKKFITKIKSVIIAMMLFVAAVFSSFASPAEVRNREIREFENTQMLMCMKAFESRPLSRS